MFEMTPFGRRRHNDNMLYNPFKDWEEWEKDFFRDTSLAEFKTDIRDDGNAYVLEADLPGFQKEDIQIDIDGNELVIHAQRHTQHEEKDKKGSYIRCERSYGSFSRSFDISSIKTEEIKASYKNGVLTLTMPKKEQASSCARRLQIE